MEHINHALVAKTHTPLYLLHKYWARKPHNIVAEYIKKYSNPRDIILDPFCGSGPTVIESLRLGRKVVGIDLNPIATFIINQTLCEINLNDFKNSYESIKIKIKDEINSYYSTKCSKCGKDAIILATIWKDDDPLSIWHECKSCKNRSNKKVDVKDLKKLKEIEKMDVPYWYPKDAKFYYPNNVKFLKKEKSEFVTDLFTKRALVVLSIIWHEIDKVKDDAQKNFMRLIFTSMLAQVSKMVPRREGDTLSGNVGWTLHSYWIPPGFREFNIWNAFENRYDKCLSGKIDSNKFLANKKKAKDWNDLINNSDVLIKNYNALNILDIIPPNSIDYVFTDPPYGGSIQYFELSTLWASWLKGEKNDKNFEIQYSDEITINEHQKKDFDYYHRMLTNAFRQIFLVLKDGKYLTVTFHSNDIKVWNSIIKAVALAGFDLDKIIYQPPAQPSVKSLSQPYGSAIGDYYIRFIKSKKVKITSEKEMDIESYEREVVSAAKKIIGERTEPTSYQHILNGIMVELKGGKRAPIGAKTIEEVLKDHLSKEFELIDLKDETGKIIAKKWWVKDWDLTHFSKPILSERIERAIITLLDKRFAVSMDDILQEIFIQFPNALTPDTQNINEILSEYAEKTKDGKWKIKTGFSELERISRHSEVIYYLATLGKKFGYNILIGKREQHEKYKNTSLSELSDKTPSFKHISQEPRCIERIKQIDVIWYRDGIIEYEFEVENTTSITDAIIRGSNIRPVNESVPLNVKRYIIIPKDKEKLLARKLDEPLIKKSMKKESWKFIIYNKIGDYYLQTLKKKKIDSISEFENLAKTPRLIDHIQTNLTDN